MSLNNDRVDHSPRLQVTFEGLTVTIRSRHLREIVPANLLTVLALRLRGLLPDAEFSIKRTGDDCEYAYTRTYESGRWDFAALHGTDEPDRLRQQADGASRLASSSGQDELQSVLRLLLDHTNGSSHDSVGWVTQSEAAARAAAPALTPREREVLHLAARGYSTSEIAVQLVLSPHTVRSHLHALFVKFGVSGRIRLLAVARALHIPQAFAVADLPSG